MGEGPAGWVRVPCRPFSPPGPKRERAPLEDTRSSSFLASAESSYFCFSATSNFTFTISPTFIVPSISRGGLTPQSVIFRG